MIGLLNESLKRVTKLLNEILGRDLKLDREQKEDEVVVEHVKEGEEEDGAGENETYVIIDAAKTDDTSSQADTESMFRNEVATVPQDEEDEEDEDVDETGFEARDTDLVMIQAGTLKAKSIKALKACNGDIIAAIIMELDHYIGPLHRSRIQTAILPQGREEEEDEDVDETGCDAKHIDLVMTQTGVVSRDKAIKALKANHESILDAIMELVF